MADPGINIGDVVQLKAGGPKMVTEKRDGAKGFLCVWIADNERKEEYFRPDVLMKADEGGPGTVGRGLVRS